MLKNFRCWAENHRHFVTNSSTGLSKLLSRCTWEQVEQKNFPMKTLHFLVPTLSGKFSLLSESFLTGLSELHSTWQQDYFENKYPLCVFPLSFSDIEQKIFGSLSNVYQLGCENCIFRVQKRSLRWTSFARKLYSFVYHFRTFRQKNLLSGRKITPFVKIAFWLSIGTIWGEVFFGNLFWLLLEI